MKNSRGIYWGSLLIIFGILWLLKSMNLLHFNWGFITPYWPVLLILAGIFLIISRSSTAKGISSVLITLAIFGAIISKSNRTFDNNNWSFGWNDNQDDWEGDYNDDNDTDHSEESLDNSYRNDRPEKRNGKPIEGKFNYKYDNLIEKAKFNLEAGAGSFELDGVSNELYEANTTSSLVRFTANTSLNRLDKTAKVDLKMGEGKISFKNGEIKNEAKVRLNKNPIWSINIGIGAGEGEFDLSEYKVENLDISTGAANLNIKLGDLVKQANIKIESGVAAVDLKIPNSAGCQIKIDGILNGNRLNGFVKVKDGLYQTPDYENTSNKINIDYSGALSSFDIDRY